MRDFKIKNEELVLYSGNQENILIPENVTKIGRDAFYYSIIEKLDINNVRHIDEYAFSASHNLKTVILNSEIYSLPDYCFNDCYRLNKVQFEYGLLKIGKFCFSNCMHLTNVRLPSSLNSIDSGSFAGSGLNYISLPRSVKFLGDGVFEECSNLESVEIKGNIDKLGEGVFDSCVNLNSVNLPSGLTYISPFAFNGCCNLKEIDLPKKISFLDHHCFAYSGIENIDLSNVSNINYNCFEDCNDLSRVILSDDLTILNSSIFKNCINLKHINFPNKLTKIDKSCFFNSGLESLYIPKNIKSIEPNAFSHCNKLKEITIESKDTKIDPSAFYMCYGIEKINYKGESINLKNFKCGYLDNDLLEFIIKNKEVIESLKAPVSIDTVYLLKEVDLLKDYLDNGYYKNYNNLYKTMVKKSSNNFITQEEQTSLFKLAYIMGVFNKDISQKSSELIMLLINNKTIKRTNIIDLVDNIKLSVLDDEIIENLTRENGKLFKEILEYCKDDPTFFSKCINNYHLVQESNKSKGTNHRQLRPTAKKFYDYFSINKFNHVLTKSDQSLAIEIGKFFDDQQVYDKAKKIMYKHKKDRVIKSIISQENRKEIIDKIEITKGLIKKTDKKLNKILTKLYYEFLNKDDPLNLTVGCYCNHCCAHLEGIGEDIAIASVLDTKTQTLVIRNVNQNIVSKATFSINSSDDIIINSIQLNENYVNNNQEDIKNKYLQAFKIFILDYKRKYKKDINHIYLSTRYSKLVGYFDTVKNISDDDYIDLIDYSRYALFDSNFYIGDAKDGVKCIYQNKENKTLNTRKK